MKIFLFSSSSTSLLSPLLEAQISCRKQAIMKIKFPTITPFPVEKSITHPSTQPCCWCISGDGSSSPHPRQRTGPAPQTKSGFALTSLKAVSEGQDLFDDGTRYQLKCIYKKKNIALGLRCIALTPQGVGESSPHFSDASAVRSRSTRAGGFLSGHLPRDLLLTGNPGRGFLSQFVCLCVSLG